MSKQLILYIFYLSANNFIEVYAQLGKTWAKILLLRQDQIIIIFRKRVFKQVVKKAEKKSEIVAISNKCKITLDEFMNSSNIESLETLRSEGTPIGTKLDLERDYLNKDKKGQRGKEGGQGDKKRRIVRKNSSLETSVYY